MRLLGPSDLFHAAGTVRSGVSGAVDDLAGLFDLVGRGALLMDRAETLVDRAERLLDGSESLALRAATALAEAEVASRGAATTLRDAQATLARAQTALDGAEGLVTEAEPLIAAVRPLTEEVAASVDRAEIEAMVSVIDRLPTLVGHLEQDVLPLLGQLDQVGPDVHAILETVSDLSHAIQGLPGIGLFRRRGERVADDADGDPERDDP